MKRLIPSFLILSFLTLNPVLAETITVSGDVYGTWSADTVLVAGEVRVPVDSTLVIDPGVKVIFQGHYKLIVDTLATLLAVGTEQDSILFTAADTSEGWHGIRFIHASDYCLLAHCTLSYGIAADMGGGINCRYTSITILRCNLLLCKAIGTNGSGGAIYCYGDSGPLIVHNKIYANSADKKGGGIYVSGYGNQSIITGNIIECNRGYWGGGLDISNSNAHVEGNIIIGNIAHYGGGIGLAWSASGFITNNIFCYNIASWAGGAIDYGGGEFEIYNNLIFNNIALGGGGIRCCEDYPIGYLNDNIIYHNFATDEGGGILHHAQSNTTVRNNTLVLNSAGSLGGGMWGTGNDSTINFILWDNTPDQLYGIGCPIISYSNIQYGWPGIGNIDEDPLFVNPDLNDYRLQWGSPCIDAGDPDPQYNDPDSTRADMGAFYYDQSVPVRILLSPHEIPYLIEPEGGTMDYTIQATNIYQSSHDVTVWCDVTLPDSSVYGPVLGPVTITIEPGETVERIRTQTVPASALMGVYHYNAYAVVDQDTSKDSFMFGKLGTSEGGMDGWGNAGDPLEEIIMKGTACCAPTGFGLFGVYPNPFNPITVLSYKLQVASRVNLAVYDVSGRKVAELVNGWRDAGMHEVSFDGSDLASGIYIYRLTTDIHDVSRKMVLMK